MLPHEGTTTYLITTHEMYGAYFHSMLYRRLNGTLALDMASNHPDFEDETHELTESEGAAWLKAREPREW